MDYNWHKNFTGYADPNKDRDILKDDLGRYRVNIFHEINQQSHDDYPPLYTMREQPFRGLPSAYLIYMTSESEYEAALKLVGSWQHWKRMQKNQEFLNGPRRSGSGWEGLNQWREEKELQDASRAYTQLKFMADNGNVQAAKTVWDKATKRSPVKKDKAKEQAEKQEALNTENDLKRIRLVASDGKQTRSN